MKRIFIDREKCVGCKNCYVACMQIHRKDDGTEYDLNLQDVGNVPRCRVLLDASGVYTPLFCRHCEDPDCVLACMSGALEKDTETGLIHYDKDRCAACFMCVMNCHYGILKPDPQTADFVVRCDFCADNDEDPYCVKRCPTKAIFLEEVE